MSPTPAAVSQLTGVYDLDPAHSRIGFVARHGMATKVRGSFKDFEGTGYFDPDKPANSSFRVTVDATSIDTHDADRDEHLRNNDFFDMDAYPRIRFASTSIERVADDVYRVVGGLTIKGVTNAVTVDLEHTGSVVDAHGDQRIGLEGSTVVNRKDWGVSWSPWLEVGVVALLAEKVTLEFDVSAIKRA
jgi:polyisoprenoid-binding protein YceI